MKGTKDNIRNQMLRAEISESQRQKAKELAKSKRMTFSGWLGLLIETELERAQAGERK
jgi:hypothetical protein